MPLDLDDLESSHDETQASILGKNKVLSEAVSFLVHHIRRHTGLSGPGVGELTLIHLVKVVCDKFSTAKLLFFHCN